MFLPFADLWGSIEALQNYTGISGGHGIFCPSQAIARAHFYSALERGEVVEVIQPVRKVLTRVDVPPCPGFREGDPCMYYGLSKR